nr:Pou3 [Halisarca dujardinii]
MASTGEETLNRINDLTSLGGAEDVRKIGGSMAGGSLEQIESDKQIAHQLMSHIINSSNTLPKSLTGGAVGIKGLQQTTTLPVNLGSNLDLSKLMNLSGNNVRAISMPLQGVAGALLQGATPKPGAVQTSSSSNSSSSTSGTTAVAAAAAVKVSSTSQCPVEAAVALTQSLTPSSQTLLNVLSTSDQQGAVNSTSLSSGSLMSLGQQGQIFLNSQSPLIRTANGQTAILLNTAPNAPVSGVSVGNNSLTGAQNYAQLASLPGSANVITIPISFGSFGSPLKLQGIPVPPLVQLPKSGKTDLMLQMDLKKETENSIESQAAATKSLMDILQDPEIQTSLAGEESHLPSSVGILNPVTSFSQATSNLVYSTTTPTPTVLSPVRQHNSSNSPGKGQKAFTVSRKRPLEIDESIDTEVEDFVKVFKQRRQALGYTQIDVGKQLGEKYGVTLSQTTICRFESIMLSAQNMKKIMSVLKKWIEEASSKFTDKESSPGKKSRKRRTTLTPGIKASLEEHFICQPKPGSQELGSVAEKVGLDHEVVRVWFCNRRQKIRRESSTTADTDDVNLAKEDNRLTD